MATTAGTPAFSLRDSAGVTIAESSDSTWTDATRWRIADEPDLVIGSVDGSVPGTDFGGYLDVVSLPQGIAVLNHQSDEIRIFDPAGRWVTTLGGRGDGPAEFRSLSAIAPVAGDSVGAWGSRARKIVTFPLAGGSPRVLGTTDRDHAGLYDWRLSAWLSDGRYLLEARSDPRTRPQTATVDSSRLILFSPAGDSLASFGPFPLWQSLFAALEGSGETRLRRFLGSSAITRASGEMIWRGFPDHGFEVLSVDISTGDRRIVRRPHDRVSPAEGAFEAARRLELDSYGGDSPQVLEAMQQTWDALSPVDRMPAYRDFLVAPDGGLWVNHMADPGQVMPEDRVSLSGYRTSNWSVFDASGRWLGTVAFPAEFELREVGFGSALGVRSDELGVSYVERYPILLP